MSKTERLAAALLADRERPTIHHNIIPCFFRQLIVLAAASACLK